MSETPDAPAIEPPPVQVKARKGSRLEQLHEAYGDAKARAKDAEAALKAITDAIKLEMTKLAPEGSRKIALLGTGVPLQLQYTETWRFDSKRFKVEDPQTYVRFAKKSGSWTLAPIKGAGEDQ